MHQDKSTIYKIAQNGHQLTVYRILKTLPGKFTVLCFWRNCCEVIAQGIYHLWSTIFWSYKIIDVIFHLYAPPTTRTHLVVFQIHELIGRHICRQDITVQLQHYRKNDTMKNNIIFPNEMDELRIVIIPVRLPIFPIIFCPLPGRRNVADRCIKPNVEHFIIFSRHLHSPI